MGLDGEGMKWADRWAAPVIKLGSKQEAREEGKGAPSCVKMQGQAGQGQMEYCRPKMTLF